MNSNDLIKALENEAWAITPAGLHTIVVAATARLNGIDLSQRTPTRHAESASGVAIIPLIGPVFHRESWIQQAVSGVSLLRFRQQIREARTSKRDGSILIEVDTLGGTVQGLTEVADEVHRTAGVKRVVVSINGLGASAGYRLASQASEVVPVRARRWVQLASSRRISMVQAAFQRRSQGNANFLGTV